jgi:tetratricopeptide (TPR) repeat protein
MLPLRRREGVIVPDRGLKEIESLYDRGLYLKALEKALVHGPLHTWGGTAGRVMAGRLSMNLGANGLSAWLHLRAWAADRTSPLAACFCAYAIADRRGPLAASRFLERLPAAMIEDADHGPDLLTLKARLAGQFRDFEQAERLLKQAEAMASNALWTICERAGLLEAQDRYTEALEAIQKALVIQPWYRPAVQRAAHLLQLLNRDDEACSLLTEALTHIESGACAGQLSAIHEELGRPDEAVNAWVRARDLQPLLDARGMALWHGRMADLEYLRGDRKKAADHARQAPDGSAQRELAEKLADPAVPAHRVVLAVGFVRQHYVTCAPATLSAVAGFLGQPVDHLALAREITYDGTPDHIERAWAERSGFVVREFRVTWEAARALLDHGIPFTLTTTEITSGHLQAVIGYDTFRETLVIRDPYQRYQGEFRVDPLLRRYNDVGPRGMVLLPQDKGALLEGIDLPEVELYDLAHRVRRALFVHDRDAAVAAIDAIEANCPGHRIVWHARRELAAYDGHPQRRLAAVDVLLEQFPESDRLRYEKAGLLRELAPRADFIEYVARLARESNEPIFWRQFALELNADASRRGEARRWMLRSLRLRPLDADSLSAAANIAWDELNFAQATGLYRIAACLRDTIDSFSRSYFLASRFLRETERALNWLRECSARHGQKSSRPARLLFWALQLLHRTADAREVLESALRQWPEDGELLLFGADAFAREGEHTRATALLAAAEPCSGRASWLRTAAALADFRCDLHQAKKLWQNVLDAEPLADDARRMTVRLVAELDGRPAARAALEAMAERFPHHLPLHRLIVEWSRAEGSAEWERTTRRALQHDPRDAWLLRELALALCEQRRFEEALTAADAALEIEPQQPASHGIRGRVLLMAGRKPEATEMVKAALRLSIDFTPSMHDLLDAASTLAERRAAAEFIRGEFELQVVFGDGLITFRDLFFTVLEPTELLTHLEAALVARPDLWQCWSCVARQLADMQRLDHALELARQSSTRFPLLPVVWGDLGIVHKLRGERPEEIRALRRALELNPAWGSAARDLAAACEATQDFAAAREVLLNAISASPLDPFNHGCLADLQWRLGEKMEALDRVITAIRIDPGDDWGWDALRMWAARLDQPGRALELAKELTELRPGEARSWFRLAQSQPEGQVAAQLDALDRAIERNPEYIDAHDQRAVLLASEGRLDEASAACAPAVFGDRIPTTLRGRAAWVESMRGDFKGAIAMMRAVVGEQPEYTWGWSMVSEWALRLGHSDLALDAADQLIRLAPRSPIPIGYKADALLRMGRRDDAVACLERAFALDPTYGFAGCNLFDHYLERRAFGEASRILDRLRAHLPGSSTIAAAARLDAAQGRRDNALTHLRTLCFAPESDSSSLREATAALWQTPWKTDVEGIFKSVMNEPGVNPEVAALWTECWVSRNDWSQHKKLLKIDGNTEAGRRARIALLTGMATHVNRPLLRRYVEQDRDALRSSVHTWGQTGYALAASSLWDETIAWLDDWRDRPGLQPWMLTNLALALRNKNRGIEADAINAHAVTLRADHTTVDHRTWIALRSALDGRAQDAVSHLNRIHPDDISVPFDQAAHLLASALVAVQSAPDAEKLAEYKRQKLALRNFPHAKIWSTPVVRQMRAHALTAMAQAAGQRLSKLEKLWDFLTEKSEDPSGFLRRWLWFIAAMTLLTFANKQCSTVKPNPSRQGSNRPAGLHLPAPAPVPVERCESSGI